MDEKDREELTQVYVAAAALVATAYEHKSDGWPSKEDYYIDARGLFNSRAMLETLSERVREQSLGGPPGKVDAERLPDLGLCRIAWSALLLGSFLVKVGERRTYWGATIIPGAVAERLLATLEPVEFEEKEMGAEPSPEFILGTLDNMDLSYIRRSMPGVTVTIEEGDHGSVAWKGYSEDVRSLQDEAGLGGLESPPEDLDGIGVLASRRCQAR